MRIRTAGVSDVAALHALVERTYRGDSAKRGWTHEADLLGGQRTDTDALTAQLTAPSHRILVAVDDDGALIGSVDIEKRGESVAYLGLLSVDPDRQAGGLGRALIAAGEELARSVFGATLMEMTVIAQRPELIAYYERRGYALTGETRPFPLDDPRFGLPTTRDLYFVVLDKAL